MPEGYAVPENQFYEAKSSKTISRLSEPYNFTKYRAYGTNYD